MLFEESQPRSMTVMGSRAKGDFSGAGLSGIRLARPF
jgi:hypothetical protein